MPDDRMIHRNAGRSRKVSGLSDFEFRVWVQFELSADDFGVMLRSAAKLQADNAYLEKKPKAAIEKALTRLIAVGLVEDFEHQGDRFIFQPDWQDWQKVKHARHTVLPFPPADTLARCTAKTRALFLEQHNGKIGAEVSEDFSNSSETFHPLARAGGRETATGYRQEATGSRQTAIARRGFSPGPLAGMLPRDHVKHAWCGERICVPAALDADFQRRIGGEAADAHAQLVAFYQRAHDAIPPGPFGDDAFDFWRRAFAVAYPSVAPQPRQQKAGLIDRMRASDAAATAMLDGKVRS